MKISKNHPCYPVTTGNVVYNHGIPLRLEIASRIMAAAYSNSSPDLNPKLRNITIEQTALDCLYVADKLIDAHNKTCEGEK